MKTTGTTGFTAVRAEGALLPVAMLAAIATGAPDLKGLAPEAYHLGPHEKINEAISRSWTRLQAAWAQFTAARDRLGPAESGTTTTRERWLLPLFQELGYGRLQPEQGAIEVAGNRYAISHRWGAIPIHLVSCRTDLDKRGTTGTSPHGLVQRLLGADKAYLWGLVSNGLRLRVLRANARLTRPAFVEFDLEAIFDGAEYPDFRLLWLLAHESRVEGAPPSACWLEHWATAAQEQGFRALETLRSGVQRAIGTLGQGYLRHPANRALRDRLRAGDLTTQEYYRQVLRQAYRLIFLCVAEDRELLLDPQASVTAGQRYTAHYSLARLRRIAGRVRGTRHDDLYASLRLVLRALGDDQGCPALALPALDSLLFASGDRSGTPDLDGCALANGDLLDALRDLAYTTQHQIRRPVNFRALGAEELGSVYEALLELQPIMNLEASVFRLETVAGNQRKTTGSFYTPTGLIDALLDSALDPVLDRAAHQADPVAAILDLKICDPACGSGHFLTRAAHRVANRLARLRAGDEEPTEAEHRQALRQVIGRCIYGVDINPMAVELCKVSLWLEAVDPGRPLSFLDHHIQCGNSLIGATPALIAAGLPDGVFEPVTGDDKAVCREYKKRNREERERGTQTLGDYQMRPWEALGHLAELLPAYAALGDEDIAALRRKEGAYADYRGSERYRYGALLADAWCAAGMWAKTAAWDYPITTQVLRRIEHNPFDLPPWMDAEIQRLAAQYRFFHWHLAFPEVFHLPMDGTAPENEALGWSGGFDVVLGNPPWEQVELKEEEFFAQHDPSILGGTGAARKEKINALATNAPELYRLFIAERERFDRERYFLQQSGRFPMTGRGRTNQYSVFSELDSWLLSPHGRVGIIVPTGIATDDTNKLFFGDLIRRRMLNSLYDFENREGLFPEVDSRMKFSLLTLTAPGAAPAAADFVTFALDAEDLAVPARHYTLARDDFRLLNPNTLTMPIFRSARDAELTRRMYRAAPVLVREGVPEVNPWGITFRQGLFNMTSDSGLFRTQRQLLAAGYLLGGDGCFRRADAADYVPLYEAKMFHQYDHRFATFEGGAAEDKARDTTAHEHEQPEYVVTPRYWVPGGDVQRALAGTMAQGLLAFRDIARSTDERTFIAAILAPIGVGHTAPLIFIDQQNPHLFFELLTNCNTITIDYITRQKLGGTHLAFFILKQLPVLPPETYARPFQGATLGEWVTRRALELTYTAYDLAPLARDLGYDGPPFHWDDARRAVLRGELDGLYAHLYGLTRADLEYILTTFPVLKKNEERQHGEYRTARLALAAYDALAGEFTQ